jgi:hypothetical protein
MKSQAAGWRLGVIHGSKHMRIFKASRLPLLSAALLSLLSVAATSPAKAAGDLLVAPTRIVLDGRRGTEVILNNIGAEEATYRISLELRRMNALGKLDDVTPDEANVIEKAALEMIRFAPRRVTLPPNQPQSIRIGLQPAEGLPDGEYRAHMLFRAIPKAAAATTEEGATEGLKINLVPVYGVTIPVIVRKGDLKASAAMSDAIIGRDNEGPALQFNLARSGNRSVFGEIRVTKSGIAAPILMAKGIAVYPELNMRRVSLSIDADIATKLQGDVLISYYEAPEAGGGLIAQLRTVLR